jgi:hypothetical protein
MSDDHINGGGYASPSKAERLEHAQISGVHGKKVFVVDSTGTQIDGATVAKQDEIITHLPLNDENRLKVSTLPGMPEVCSGVLTTTTAPATEIAGVGCVGGNGYIAVDVSRASNVMFSIQNTGTVNMAAGQFAIEASLDSTNGIDGTWIAIQAVRSNANTIVTNTGTITANVGLGAGFGFETSVNANMWFRLRVTTNVTTNAKAKWTILRGAYATEPIPAAQPTSTQAVSLAAAATAIAKAEDSASASANVGVPPLSVRSDTLPADAGVSANGDYAFIFCDVNGRVYVTSKVTESALPTGAATSAKQDEIIANYAQKITESGGYTYVAVALPGTLQSAASWQVKRIDETTAGTTIITWADGNANFDNVATNLTTLSYS